MDEIAAVITAALRVTAPAGVDAEDEGGAGIDAHLGDLDAGRSGRLRVIVAMRSATR
jgi:hypothetical protein